MGTDLKLLPIRWYGASFSHEILEVWRDSELFERIRALPSYLVEAPFTCMVARPEDEDSPMESGYGERENDEYGDRLMFVLAKDLKTADIGGPVGAFVGALEDKTKIVLFWC